MAVQPPSEPDPHRPASASARGTVVRALLWPAAAVGLGLLLISNSLNSETPADLKPPPPAVTASASPGSSAAATPAAVVPATPDTAAAGPALPRSAPKRLSIPQIAVDAPFTALSIGASGQLDAPPAQNSNLVGWFRGGATPGERGSSIVAGHVDTKTGPAVFVRLSTLKPGSVVNVTREDGIVATFKVDSVEIFSKADFPDDRVYADTPSPQLRLITCGGAYDEEAQDYEDNVVVFAHLDSARRA